MNDALNSTWHQLHSSLRSFIYRRVKDSAAADDLVQEVYLRANSRVSQLNEPDRMAGWIFQIARNKITDYFRQKARRLDPAEMISSDNQQLLTVCASECLKDTLNQLPNKYRQALELAEIENLPQTELATRLGISYSGVKSRVQRARRLLKTAMDERYRIETDTYGNVLVCKALIPCNCSQKAEGCD